ncbi:MAG: ATP synthase F1 subunit gamma [Ignavibacteria bacterium]|nr:ATP synthase F1 subunit gamma [Ignavibacteria bacterium]
MATLRDIRRRIGAVRNTAKITSAMKMVSAAKMRRAHNAIENALPYFSKLEDTVSNLISIANDYSNPFIETRSEIKNIAIVLIGSDRGLCGSFNTNLFKSLNIHIEDFKKQYPNANFHIVPVGKKAVSFVKRFKIDTIREFSDIFSKLRFEDAQQIVASLTNLYLNNEVDKIFLFYNEFINILKQVPQLKQLFPIEPAIEQTNIKSLDYIFEPSKEQILDVLIPKLIDARVWKALLESNAAEQAARMMAMDNATSNANDLIRMLELQYNKERQASITKEMLEIVGGAEALKSK